MIKLWMLDLDPEYQRSHVWTREQQSLFVGHLLSGGETTQLIINELPDQSTEIVDGKQRFTACLQWVNNEFPATTWNGETIWYKDLDHVSTTILGNRITLPFLIVQLSGADILKLYIRLNRGGTVHSDEEIARVKALLDAEMRK
jgi:hypothetical protein